MQYKYFRLGEFDCPSRPGSGDKMNAEFVQMLDRAREIAGIPFVITSGYRTIEHNKRVGGAHSSEHLNGLAADIKVVDDISRYTILSALIMVGMPRIGIYSKHIHADKSLTKKGRLIWLGTYK